MEDGDSEPNQEGDKEGYSNAISDAGDIFQPFGLRCSFVSTNEVDRFLLDFNFGILPYIGGIFYLIFLLF